MDSTLNLTQEDRRANLAAGRVLLSEQLLAPKRRSNERLVVLLDIIFTELDALSEVKVPEANPVAAAVVVPGTSEGISSYMLGLLYREGKDDWPRTSLKQFITIVRYIEDYKANGK